MLAKMMHQFLFNITWGELDLLLLVDLPPGTGDVQITLTQVAPLTAALIVTTPSAIALEDVRRGVEMFRQTEVPIVGLVENMSYFHCDNCGHTDPIFGVWRGPRHSQSLGHSLSGRDSARPPRPQPSRRGRACRQNASPNRGQPSPRAT